MNRHSQRRYVLFLAASVAIGILLIDFLIELGVAVAVSYIIVVWLAYAARSRRAVWIAAIVCSLFTVSGYAFSPPGSEVGKVLTNRGLGLTAIWGTTFLCLRVLQLLVEHAKRAETAERAVADVARKLDDDARRRLAMANVMEDLAEEREALKREIQARQNVQELLQDSEQRFFARGVSGLFRLFFPVKTRL